MDNPFVGMLASFGFNFAPRNWGLCYGGIIAISQNQTLFSLIGTQYGGDGRLTFGLPDMRGRAAIGQGQGPGLSNYTWGQRGGQETVTLTHSNLPTHNHDAVFTPTGGGTPPTFEASATAGSLKTPAAGDYLGSGSFSTQEPLYVPAASAGTTVALGGVSGGSGSGGTVTIGNTGASNPFYILQPFLVINWSICLVGLYPPRN